MLRQFFSDVTAGHLVNTIIAFIFAVTGPIAILLTVGGKTGLA